MTVLACVSIVLSAISLSLWVIGGKSYNVLSSEYWSLMGRYCPLEKKVADINQKRR